MLAGATHSTVQSWERTLITITIIVVVIVIALLGINARASCKLGQHIDTELWSQPQTVNPCNFFYMFYTNVLILKYSRFLCVLLSPLCLSDSFCFLLSPLPPAPQQLPALGVTLSF